MSGRVRLSVKAVVFDLDGTLIDSIPDILSALNRMLREMGRRPLSAEELNNMVGEGAVRMLDLVFEATGGAPVPEMFERMLESYKTHYRNHPADGTMIYPYARELLETLSSHGVAMGICTNKPHDLTVAVLEALELNSFFSAILGAEAIPHRKPDGRHVIATLEMMGTGTDGAIMIGDSETDINAARNAGIPVVAVSYGYSKGGPSNLRADHVIDSLKDLYGLISYDTRIGPKVIATEVT